MNYSFKEQLNDPRQKEAVNVVIKYLKDQTYEVADVSEDPKFYADGIDLFKKIGDELTSIDVKCDFQAHNTGNVPLELMEIIPTNSYVQPKTGWGYKNIDEIIYFIWETKEIIPVNLAKLRELAFSKDYRIFNAKHKNYFSSGLLIPIADIKAL